MGVIAWVAGLDDLWAIADTSHSALGFAVVVGHVAGRRGIATSTRARKARAAASPARRPDSPDLAVASRAMVYRHLDGASDAVAFLALGWAAGWTAIALGSWRTRDDVGEDEHEPGLPTRASVTIPSTPFALAVLGAAYAGVHGELHGFLIWNAAAVIVLIVMRQVLALLENISFWRELERKLTTRERRFRELVQNSSDVIAVFSADGEAQYVSPSGQSIAPDDMPRLAEAARGLSPAVPGRRSRSSCGSATATAVTGTWR